MGLKTRLSSYCTKRANNGVNLVTSRKINTRLACPIRGGGVNWLQVIRHNVYSPSVCLAMSKGAASSLFEIFIYILVNNPAI